MMSFKPNRELLNPNFNGYKLADHSLPLLWETFTGGLHKISNTHFCHINTSNKQQ
uniref:Uncharacterized protein n=1 Tax=Amphimedon queenslandica TaxID=400682 RepID=A0A1X7TGC6_AMPQE